MGRFTNDCVDPSLPLDPAVVRLLNDSNTFLDTGTRISQACSPASPLSLFEMIMTAIAGNATAVQALTLQTARLNATLEVMLLRFEPVDESDDYVSLEDPSERTPPEKTASGE